MNGLFCLKWDPCERQKRREKGVFRAAHPHTPFLGQCPPPGNLCFLCGSNFKFPAAHPQQNQSWVPPPFQCLLCPHNKSKKCLTKQNKKQETKKKMICPGVYYVHVWTSLLIHSTKALCGKWPWWMSIQELLLILDHTCLAWQHTLNTMTY